MQSIGLLWPWQFTNGFPELGVGEALGKGSANPPPWSFIPLLLLPWLSLVIPSGSGQREDQRCKFPPHPCPRGARSIDLGGAQPCVVGKTLQVSVTQYQSLRKHCMEQRLPAAQWVPFLGNLKSESCPVWSYLSGNPERHFWVTPRPFYGNMMLLVHPIVTVQPGTHPAFSHLGENALTSVPTQQIYEVLSMCLSVWWVFHVRHLILTITLWVIPPLDMIKLRSREVLHL